MRIEMSDKVKVTLVIVGVLAVNLLLWKLGAPTKWDVFQWFVK